MKKIIIILCLILCGSYAFADCSDRAIELYSNRAALYNVLNLSADQIKCKDVIDKKRYDELKQLGEQHRQEKYVLDSMIKGSASDKSVRKQECIVKNIEKNIIKTGKKYDKEFKCVLDSEQKSKLNVIRKMERRDLKYCKKHKRLFKPDKNLRPFGTYTTGQEVLCPKHKKWHIFGIRHEK